MATELYTFSTIIEEFVVDDAVSSDQGDPDVAVLADGSMFFTYDANTAQDFVRGKIFNLDGSERTTTAFQVNSTAINDQFDSHVAALTNGQAVTTFTDLSGAASSVRFRIFNSNGTAPANDVAIAVAGNQPLRESDVAALNDGGFVVTYTRQFAADTDATYTVFNADLSIRVAFNQVIENSPSFSTEFSSVAPLTNGGFVIAAVQTPAAGGNSSVMVRRFLQTGLQDGGVLTVDATGTVNNQPQVVGLTDGGFVVAYTENGSPGGSGLDISFKIFNADGTVRTDITRANATTAGTQDQPAIVALPGGHFFIAWITSPGINGNDVFGQLFSPTGVALGNEFQLELGADNQLSPTLAARPDGTFVATWRDEDQPSMDGSAGIQAQVFRPNHNLTGDATDEILLGSALTDVINGNGGADQISGFDSRDFLNGNDGDDTINGGAGQDSLNGNNHNDILDGGTDADTINGGSGNDTMIGGAGADVLNGGDDIDTASYSSSPAAVAVSLPSLSGVGGDAAGDTLLNIENLIGSAFDDQFLGTSGDNLFDGLAGSDHMNGGGGIDTVTYANSNAGVAVSLPSQSGVGGHAAGDTLLNIENLIGSAFDDQFLGTAGVNVFNSGGGNDFLDGGASADWLDGGAGSDTVTYANSSNGVAVSLPSQSGVGGDAAGDSLIDIENLIGSAFGDQFLGTSGANQFDGGEGNDHLDGGAGGDELVGGTGVDTVSYANSNAGVAVSLPSESGVGGHAAGDGLFGIENLIGSAFDDQFLGTSGDNLFDGLAGSDHMNGGGGIDTVTYANSNAGVAVSLPSQSGVGGHAAGDTLLNIENLIGSAFDDQFLGTSGDNLFDGLAGSDHMNGGGGIDTVTYANSNAGVAVSLPSQSGVGGHAAGDTLLNIENLIGSAFDDQFLGDAGANQFTGGGGNDFFSFNGSFGSDVIFDFTAGAGVGDTIQLDDAQFANFAAVLAATADDGFGNTAIYHAAGQIALIGVVKSQLNADDFQFV